MTVFIDSDIMMEVLRGEDKEVVSLWNSLATADTAILFSAITPAEIWAAARASEHVQIMKLFRPLLCIPVDREIGKLAGEYLRKYASGHDLTLVDALIAASAIRHQAALWTCHRHRYPIQELSFYHEPLIAPLS
jgi:predicted nucleic acid-binding protein